MKVRHLGAMRRGARRRSLGTSGALSSKKLFASRQILMSRSSPKRRLDPISRCARDVADVATTKADVIQLMVGQSVELIEGQGIGALTCKGDADVFQSFKEEAEKGKSSCAGGVGGVSHVLKSYIFGAVRSVLFFYLSWSSAHVCGVAFFGTPLFWSGRYAQNACSFKTVTILRNAAHKMDNFSRAHRWRAERPTDERLNHRLPGG